MQIGQLNRRIDILRQDDQRDSYGGIIGEWVKICSVWANIVPVTSKESFVSDRVQSTSDYKITIRYLPLLTTLDRLVYKGKCLEITGVKDLITDHKWLEITAKELADGI